MTVEPATERSQMNRGTPDRAPLRPLVSYPAEWLKGGVTHKAICHCGRLKLHCEGEPVRVSLCHCFDCQRRTGSLFSVAAFFRRHQVLCEGEVRSFRRAAASGLDVTFHFCPLCGSNLWWEPERLPQLIGVAVGAFADKQFRMPEQAVWAEDKHSWLLVPERLPSHPRDPPPRGSA